MTTLTYPLESARGCKTSLQRRYSTSAYTTLLQLFGRVGRGYNSAITSRYGICDLGKGDAWTTKNSRGTS
jgi:hypothetical protein